MATKPVPANPEVLAWARSIAGLERDEAAHKLKIEPRQLDAIEQGAQPLPLGVFRRMATAYGLPAHTLLMPEPLSAPELPTDMRKVGGKAPHLSPRTRRVIREVQERRDLASDLVREAPDLVPQAELPKASLDTSIPELAHQERERLGIAWQDQLKWQDAAEALRNWRSAIESLGILVFGESMPRDEVRGFCLWDGEQLPVIVFNSAESDQARIFTLFHEYAHLLLRTDAICLEDDEHVDRANVERFCNRFSAALLMPPQAVDEVARATNGRESDASAWSIDRISRAAKLLKVSRPAVVIRLAELGQLNRQAADRLLEALDQDAWRPSSDSKGGPAFATVVVSRLGTQYTGLVLRALSSGLVDRQTASEMLNAPAKQFEAVAETLRNAYERSAAV